MPLAGAGGGEAGGPKSSSPVLSAAQALQRLAVVRPDLDPDSSPFAKIFKAATGSAQPSESTLQRASDSGRRVVETFQRGGPRPNASAAPAAPIQPRTDRPPASIQRRADPSAPPAPAPPGVTPPPERPPATPSSRALRRFAKVEEVVPPNFTPPADDFGDDLPEPGGPAIQRALPPMPDEALPLARRPDTVPQPARAPATVVQPRRPAVSAPAPKRQARPAPAPARLQRRAAGGGSRPTPQVDLGREVPVLPQISPAPPPRPAADAGVELGARAIEAAPERREARPPISIQRKPDAARAASPTAADRPPAPADPRSLLQAGAEGEPIGAVAPSRSDAPPAAPIQREPQDAPAAELPLARPVRPDALSGATPRESSAERAVGPTASPGVALSPSVAAPPPAVAPSVVSGAQDVTAASRPPPPIQRATREEAAKELPLARLAEPVPTTPAPSIQRAPIDDAAKDPPLVRPSEPADISPVAAPPAVDTQRASIDDAAKDLPLVRPAEPADIPPAAIIQRAPIGDAAKDLPLVRPAEPADIPPAAAPPVAAIQRAASDDAAKGPPLVRLAEPAPEAALPPAVTVQRAPVEDAAKAMPLVRGSEPSAAPAASPIQRSAITDAVGEQPRARPSEPPAAGLIQPQLRASPDDSLPLVRPQEPTPPTPPPPPPAPIQRLPDAGQPVEMPLARTPAPEMPPAGEPLSRAQSPLPASDEIPESPPIRPRPSALNLARRAVQRMLGDERSPKPSAAPAQGQPLTGGDTPPKPGPGGTTAQIVRREQDPGMDFALRRVPSTAIAPEEPESGAAPGQTSEVNAGMGPERRLPMPARIQRASEAAPAMARAQRGGEAFQPGADAPALRRAADRGDDLPLVVPLLAAQSQSAARHIQRAETAGPSAAAATRTAPQKTLRRAVDRASSGEGAVPAPDADLNPPTPEQPAPAKGNEPDFNYDLLAQRVYPFIRRLLAFERERERGS